MISFSTSSYTVTFLPSFTSFTLLPSLSLRATLAVTLTVSKLSFSFTPRAIRPSATLRISLALASVVTILPFARSAVTCPLISAFLCAEVLLSFLYFAIFHFLHFRCAPVHASSDLLSRGLAVNLQISTCAVHLWTYRRRQFIVLIPRSGSVPDQAL